MFISIINDCADANAAGRQVARVQSLLGQAAHVVGVSSDLEAAGNLIDILDAGEGREGVVLVNVAPRSGEGKKWENGTPFGFFSYKNTYVFSTIDGLTLSLVKKFGLAETISVFDSKVVVGELQAAGMIDVAMAEYIIGSQFRSFDFLPRVAAHVAAGESVSYEPRAIEEIADAPQSIWWVDNFGNAKTTLVKGDSVLTDAHAETAFGALPFYEHLKDVPEGQAALIEGSSGLSGKRFLEIVVQNVNGSAREKFGVASGDSVF
jgi:hypothetical protein